MNYNIPIDTGRKLSVHEVQFTSCVYRHPSNGLFLTQCFVALLYIFFCFRFHPDEVKLMTCVNIFKGTVMQIERALINDRLVVSKVS